MRPPGPRGQLLVGNLRAYEEDRLGFLLRARDRYGDVVAFDDRTTIINGGALSQALLLDRGRDFALHENFLQEPLSPEQDEQAVRLRRLLNPGLREAAAAEMLPCLIRRLDQEMAAWSLNGGRPRDPVAMMERAIAASVAEYYFGADGEALAPLLAELLQALSRTILDPLVLPWRSLSPARRESRRRYQAVSAEVCRLLTDRCGQGARDFAGRILQADTGRTPVPRLADLVMGSMLAGQRVPAAAAAWTLMMVADSPALVAALRREADSLDRRLRTGGATAVRLDDHPWAMACVLEALRLYPATWLITRRALRAVEVGGFRFRAGHHFMVSPYVIHRDCREFPQATEFVPQRWLESSRPTGTYLPFGHGQHICPGRHLAVLSLAVALLRVVHSGQVARPAREVVPNPRTTLLPDGLLLTCVSWSSQPAVRPYPVRASCPGAG